MPTITYSGTHVECHPPRYEVVTYHVYVTRFENGYRTVTWITPELHDDLGQDRVVQMLADNLSIHMAAGHPC